MKSKKILSLTSFILGATLLSACTGMYNPVTFNDNWKTNPEANSPINETLVYNVSYSKNDGLIEAYEINYTNGEYVANLSTVNEDGKTYYLYQTELSIDVIYEYGSATKQFTDTVSSEIKFARAADRLRPVYSKKTLNSHSPSNGAVENIDDCYYAHSYTVETTYNANLTEGKTVITEHTAEGDKKSDPKTFEIDEEDTRYLDNEQLIFALRGVNPTSFPTANFLVYAPFTKAVQQVKATFPTSAEGATFKFHRNGTQIEQNINYRSVKLALNTNNPGAEQTIWIAEKSENNVNRNVILKMETPLSYGIGSLVYTLTSETYSES